MLSFLDRLVLSTALPYQRGEFFPILALMDVRPVPPWNTCARPISNGGETGIWHLLLASKVVQRFNLSSRAIIAREEVIVMNVYRFRSTLCLSFILAAICSTAYATDLILNNVPVKVCFCPGRGCIHAIIHEINNARQRFLSRRTRLLQPTLRRLSRRLTRGA